MVIAYIVKAVIGLRVNEEVETVGLDLAEHGEEAYHGGSMGGHMTRPSAAASAAFGGMEEAIRPRAHGNEAV